MCLLYFYYFVFIVLPSLHEVVKKYKSLKFMQKVYFFDVQYKHYSL